MVCRDAAGTFLLASIVYVAYLKSNRSLFLPLQTQLLRASCFYQILAYLYSSINLINLDPIDSVFNW